MRRAKPSVITPRAVSPFSVTEAQRRGVTHEIAASLCLCGVSHRRPSYQA